MTENLYNKAHKATNDSYRKGYANTFNDIKTPTERKQAHFEYLLHKAQLILSRRAKQE